ncbi:MAG: hypothetical protein WC979_01735 [Candidatus Pacearchaeota archaeon]|jgi:hypothetical protein|nr:hypothetical protein [Clostridia bacterium]
MYKNKCKICGQLFNAKSPASNRCDNCITVEKHCVQCNSVFTVINSDKGISQQFCCKSCAATHVHNKIDVKKRMSDFQKKRQNTPAVKEAKSKFQKEYQNRPEVKAETFKRLQRCFKYKEFILPSGKIVKIQGYEPQVLTELLKTYNEDDIIIGIKEMNKSIGKIDYFYENNVHTYYPDFYIKSINTIIEVKSEWTYSKELEKNLAKQQACLAKLFNFEFVIIN